MPVQQATRATLARQATEELERLISSGEWPLGKKIPSEPGLATALGVSRNTVREAVQALVYAGLLDTRPGDGTYVTSTDGLGAALVRRLRQGMTPDIVEVCHMIQRNAAKLAAARRNEQELGLLRTLHAAQSAALAAGDRETYLNTGTAFHAAVVSAAHNPMLSQLCLPMIVSVHDGVSFGLSSALEHSEHVTLHGQLLDAIANRDERQAVAATNGHLALAGALNESGTPIRRPEPS